MDYNDNILSLTFLPLMSGSVSRDQRAIESIKLAQSIEDSQVKLECTSMLYALLDKFRDKIVKKTLKEVMTMTEIGKMIRDEGVEEGIEKGIEKGKTKGKSELIVKMLMKKFKKLPSGYIEKINHLSDETLDTIATDIFDISKVEKLEKYF